MKIKTNILPMVMLTSGVIVGTIIMAIFGNAKLPEMPIAGQVFAILSLLLIAIALPIAWNSEG